MMSALTLTIIGMTPNLPGLSPFAEASMGALILAQAAPDISSVPAEDVKNFLLMSAFMAAIGGAYWYGQRGTKADPVHVHQPVHVEATVKPSAEHAPKSELEKLWTQFEAEKKANLEEHKAHRAAHSTMVRELLEKGNERERKITGEVHQAKDELMRALLEHAQTLHERINPVAETVKGHGKAIEGLGAQLKQLWDVIAPHFGLGIKKGK